MSRKLHQTQVEILVDAWLTRFKSTNKVRGYRQIIDKASKLIGITLHDPCCDPDNFGVAYSRLDHQFTLALEFLLRGIDVRANRQSLVRAKQALDDTLNDPCCTQPTQPVQIDVNYTLPAAYVANVEFRDLYSDEILATIPITNLISSSTSTSVVNVPVRDSYKVCIHEISVSNINQKLTLRNAGGTVIYVQTPSIAGSNTCASAPYAAHYNIINTP